MPPIAIYIHPLSSQPYAFATDAFRSSPLAYLPTLPADAPLTSTLYLLPLSLQPSLFVASLSSPLSHLRSFNPSSHRPSPPLRFCHHSAMLSRTPRWCGGFANARIRLVSDSRHYFFHEEVCISYYCKRSASLRRFFSRARGSAFIGCAYSESPDNSRCLDRRSCLHSLTLIRSSIYRMFQNFCSTRVSANLFN